MSKEIKHRLFHTHKGELPFKSFGVNKIVYVFKRRLMLMKA